MTDEIELLGLFADFAELSRNRPAGEDLHTELRVHSSKEHFHAYLQSLDVERGGLPQQFRDRLARVLAHYGVTDWDRTPELEEAVFRIFLAQQRSAPEVRWRPSSSSAGSPSRLRAEELAGPVRDLLERLVRSTQLRFPVVGDLARSTRFRWFDQPLVDAERSSVLAGVRDEVAALAADPDAPDRTARMEALAAIPEQIVRFLAERLENGVPEQEPMLEVLVRRHYREHDLHGLRSVRARGPHVRGGRLHPRRPPDPGGLDRRHHRRAGRPRQRAGHRRRRRGRRPQRPVDEAVVDLYVHWPDVPESPEQASEELARIVGALPFAHDVRRVAVAVCPGGDRPVNYFTYRPARRRRGRRGRPGPRRAPDGRPPARPVAAARLPRHPHRRARGRAPLRVRRAGEPRRPPARRPGPGPPARRRPRRGGQGHRRCPTRSGRWRTASRRSGASARRAARPGASSTPTTCGSRSGPTSRPIPSS